VVGDCAIITVHIDRFTFEASIKAAGQELLFWPVADLMHLFVLADDCVEKHCPQGLQTNHAYLVIIRWMRSQQSTQTPPFCLATLCHLNEAVSCFSSCAAVTLNPKLIFLVQNIYPLLLVQEGINNLAFCLQTRKRVSINAFPT
jgi:hypothetical protein